LPLNNLTDFINQFNLVGFHDICNYPTKNELKLHYGSPKGFVSYYPGYDKYNSTGQNLNNNNIDQKVENVFKNIIFKSV